MTTTDGSSPIAATTGTQCANLSTGVVPTDAYGDGCLAVNGIFGVGAFNGLATDPFGNVLVNDDIKRGLPVVNPDSGIMTLVAGGGTGCSISRILRVTDASPQRVRPLRQSPMHAESALIQTGISSWPATTITLFTSSVPTLDRCAEATRRLPRVQFKFPSSIWI